MIWKTTNALGQEVTWYSEGEIRKIKNTLQKAIEPDTKEQERIIHICNLCKVRRIIRGAK